MGGVARDHMSWRETHFLPFAAKALLMEAGVWRVLGLALSTGGQRASSQPQAVGGGATTRNLRSNANMCIYESK